MNLRTVDLNLLVILDALLDEAHVSRAALRLGLSQPAVSNALERCRAVFGDPLLERGRGVMRLTKRATALRAPLRAVLAETAALIHPHPRQLRDLRQTVRVIMADHPATTVIANLYAHLCDSAPGIDLILQPWQGEDAAVERLRSGSSDLAAGVFRRTDPPLRRKDLGIDHFVAVMRKAHPAARRFTLERWLDYPHILVSARGGTRGDVDGTLADMKRTRRIGIVVPSFALAPALLETSDLIALLPRRCLPGNAENRFAVRAPPIPIEDVPLALVWHQRLDTDPATQHVAHTIKSLMS